MPEIEDRLLKTSEMLKYLPYRRSHVMKLVAEGRFPKPIKLSSRRLCWSLDAVRKWIAEQKAA